MRYSDGRNGHPYRPGDYERTAVIVFTEGHVLEERISQGKVFGNGTDKLESMEDALDYLFPLVEGSVWWTISNVYCLAYKVIDEESTGLIYDFLLSKV